MAEGTAGCSLLLGISVVFLFVYPEFLVLLLLLLIFLSQCHFQQIVLILTHDLYILCLQLSSPSCCKKKRERKRSELAVM